MTDEPDNTAEAVTDNVNPSDNDTPPDWDFFDPDEDQDNEEVTNEEGTDDEAEGEELAEDEAEEAPEDDADEKQEPQAASDDAIVKLADGTTATVKDLVLGNMRQDDYSRKSQAVANARREVEANADRINRITEAFVEHLTSMMPQEPDPALAYSNPRQYQAQKAQYDATMAQVQKLIAIGDQPKEIKSALTKQQRAELIQEENSKLVHLFPEAGTQAGRQAFFAGVQGVAESIGFTADELNQVTDHRIFALAHWAKKGMEADKAKTKAKAKVASTTPRKPGKGARQANRNAEKMRKLSRTGSIRDAMAVDFD